ncbi:MAG TPA: metallophosphoesterase [Aggregatilineales bacterium]|nr:metallophosphoesterase [Aggregatilineales bacterium]
MKILCVSDTVLPQLENAVNLRRRYNDVELIISCGDLPPTYLDYISSVLNVPLFYVRGNHDESYDENPPGGENLHMRVLKHGNLTFTGIEGSNRYNNGTVQYRNHEVFGMVARMGPRLMIPRWRRGRGVDVLVTHSPAFGIHDREDIPHKGFKALRRFMDWYRPRYMLHGHVHTYDRRDTVKTEYGSTCVMNINPSTVLDIEPADG